MILDFDSKIFGLRIIEYVWSQRTAKTYNMERFATIVIMSNDFIEQYPEYRWADFENKGSEIFFLNFLWWSDCYISSSSSVFP